MSNFMYITRDKFFDESFFERIKSSIGRYWKDMPSDLKVNGIRWSPTEINIMVVRTKDVGIDWIWNEWSHNIDNRSSSYYKEVSGCIYSVMRDKKLEELGV